MVTLRRPADPAAFNRAKSSTLSGYATDLLRACDALKVEDGVFVGHSVSAMVGVLAAIREPRRFSTPGR